MNPGFAWPFSSASSLNRISSAKTWVSQALRSPSFEPKWCLINPPETPAAWAMSRIDVFSAPCSVNSLMAASRMRARAVRSSKAGPLSVMERPISRRSLLHVNVAPYTYI